MKLDLMWRFALLLAVVVVTVGCAGNTAPVDSRNSALTHGNVQMHVKVGTTTQAEVLETFGAPNVATIDGQGREVWSYQRAATVSQSNSNVGGWTIVVAGGLSSAAGFSSSSRMITLIIKFDNSKVVSDFNSRSSDF